MMKGMGAGCAPSPGHHWVPAPGAAPGRDLHPSDLLGARRWMGTGVCLSQPCVLVYTVMVGSCAQWLDPFLGDPQAPRGSVISSALVAGQALLKGRRSSSSGKEPLSLSDPGTVPASALGLPGQSLVERAGSPATSGVAFPGGPTPM